MRQRALVLLVAMSAAMSAPKVAAEIEVAKEELRLLPEFCRQTQAISSNSSISHGPEAAKWVAYMGPGFWAMHHYCWGLVRIMRSERANATARERNFWRESSLNEFDYVLRNTSPSFVMRADVLAKKGEVLTKLSRYREAEGVFREAIVLRPTYEAVYFHLANALYEQGRSADALAVVDEGIALLPDAQFLPKLRQRILASTKR